METTDLTGQDVVVIMLSFAGLQDEGIIVEAASKAGVKYVLPSEYGKPFKDDHVVEAIPFMKVKKEGHTRIEALGMKWIGVATNSWFDYVSR